MTLHIDMGLRKTAPFPSDVRATIDAVARAHAQLPRPEGIGRSVSMPKR